MRNVLNIRCNGQIASVERWRDEREENLHGPYYPQETSWKKAWRDAEYYEDLDLCFQPFPHCLRSLDVHIKQDEGWVHTLACHSLEA